MEIEIFSLLSIYIACFGSERNLERVLTFFFSESLNSSIYFNDTVVRFLSFLFLLFKSI